MDIEQINAQIAAEDEAIRESAIESIEKDYQASEAAAIEDSLLRTALHK